MTSAMVRPSVLASWSILARCASVRQICVRVADGSSTGADTNGVIDGVSGRT